MKINRAIIGFFFMLLLSGCMNETSVYAPVSEVSTIDPLPKSGRYRVLPDDSVYSIAWRYGMDYRYLAKLNQLRSPYRIHTGQILYLKKAVISTSSVPKPVEQKTFFIPSKPMEREPTAQVTAWQWPARGPVVGTFSGLNKGINIGGHIGDLIVATAPGKVVYSGDGIRGYGNLIIIKHNGEFLTAYAHNSTVFVKEGEWVKRGQRIAWMGSTGAKRPMLHFEIRKSGAPVNPLVYLSGRGSV